MYARPAREEMLMIREDVGTQASASADVVAGWYQFLDACRQDQGYAHGHQGALDRSELSERWALAYPGLQVPSVEWSDSHGQYVLNGLNIPKIR
jgi:hypothetical protein